MGALALLLAGCGWLVALPAQAHCGIQSSGHFCGYAETDYQSTQLIHSGAAAGSNEVDVANDDLESARNGSGNRWCGYTNVILQPPDLLFDFASHTGYKSIGTAANRIDWFNVRSMSVGCP